MAKTVAEKLQMKPGCTVMVVNAPENDQTLLGGAPEGVAIYHEAPEPANIIHLFVVSRAELEAQLGRLKALLAPNGLWVSYYKGTLKKKGDIHRDSIDAYGRTRGLEGVASVSIDEDWSAVRFKVV